MRNLILILLFLFTAFGFSTVETKKNELFGIWTLTKHTLTIDNVEKTCFDSTYLPGATRQNSLYYQIFFEKWNNYKIFDFTKSDIYTGKWKLLKDKNRIILHGSKMHPIDPHEIVYGEYIPQDKVLNIISVTKDKLILQETFCSKDTVGTSYYTRVK